jgi:hypothetical protein
MNESRPAASLFLAVIASGSMVKVNIFEQLRPLSHLEAARGRAPTGTQHLPVLFQTWWPTLATLASNANVCVQAQTQYISV